MKGKSCAYERCSKPSFESKEFSRNVNYGKMDPIIVTLYLALVRENFI